MPVVTETVDQAKALCVVWNSTPVLLQLLNMRTKTLTYLNWSVSATRIGMCTDLGA